MYGWVLYLYIIPQISARVKESLKERGKDEISLYLAPKRIAFFGFL